MRLFFTLARKYPWQTILTLVAILFAGISEGFGVSSLLPLLNTLFNQASQDGDAAGSQPAWSQTIDQIVQQALGVIGLAPSVAILLSLFVACIALKCLLVYLANKQIGLTVVMIATDMRLTLLKSLFASRLGIFHPPAGRAADQRRRYRGASRLDRFQLRRQDGVHADRGHGLHGPGGSWSPGKPR